MKRCVRLSLCPREFSVPCSLVCTGSFGTRDCHEQRHRSDVFCLGSPRKGLGRTVLSCSWSCHQQEHEQTIDEVSGL